MPSTSTPNGTDFKARGGLELAACKTLANRAGRTPSGRGRPATLRKTRGDGGQLRTRAWISCFHNIAALERTKKRCVPILCKIPELCAAPRDHGNQ